MLEPIPRAKDPLWIEACRLWDQLAQAERAMIVKAMRLITQGKVFVRNNESLDIDAGTPQVS